MKKLIIAACGFMMALSTAAFAADAENTDSTTVEHSKTFPMGHPKKVTKRKVVKKGANGEEKATIVDTEIKTKKGVEHTQEVEGSAKEVK